jgi:hypothetical protein
MNPNIHPSAEQIKGFHDKRLAAQEGLQVWRHFRECGQCHQILKDYIATARGTTVPQTIVAANFENNALHLDYDTMIEPYVRGLLDSYEITEVEHHISECSRCSQEVRSLKAFANRLGPFLEPARSSYTGQIRRLPIQIKHIPWQYAGVAICLVILLSTGLIFMRYQVTRDEMAKNGITRNKGMGSGLSPSPVPSPSITYENHANPNATPKPSGNKTISVKTLSTDKKRKRRQTNSVEPLYPTPPRIETGLGEALQAMHLRVPVDSLAKLIDDSSKAVRSGDDPSNYQPSEMNPTGRVIESDRPTLTWASIHDAKAYRVLISILGGNLVHQSPSLSNNSYQLAIPLKRGEKYIWQVEVELSDGSMKLLPSNQEPEARFAVIESKIKEAIDDARTSKSFLELGIHFANAGLINEAENAFLSYLNDHPASAKARELLDKLRKAKKQLGNSSNPNTHNPFPTRENPAQ